jgi:hypothetical protein
MAPTGRHGGDGRAHSTLRIRSQITANIENKMGSFTNNLLLRRSLRLFWLFLRVGHDVSGGKRC